MQKYCVAAAILGWLLSEVHAGRAAVSRITLNSTKTQDGASTHGPLDFLELDYPTRQKKNTGGCWLLSVLEALRLQGYIEAVFTQGLISVSSVGEEVYEWQTSALERGRFKVWSEITPLWQQVLESIFIKEFPGKKAADFQSQIQTRLGGGKRSDDIQAYLQRIDSKISVDQNVFYFRAGQKPADVKEFVKQNQPTPSTGSTIAFTIDKWGTHAVAVTERPQWETGYGWCAKTYNQASSQEDEYLLNGATCESTYNKKRICDTLWAYNISGLPTK